MSRPEPIPVAVLRFALPMDSQGLSVATSCSARNDSNKKQSRFEIQYLPWLRSFEIRYFAPSEDAPRISMIPDCHVKSWDPVLPVPMPSAVQAAPEAKRR